jgi:ABC-type multidrug transport system ATPase subunit
VAYIYFGKIIADGTPKALKQLPEVQPRGTKRIGIVALDTTRALRVARTLPAIRSATLYGDSLHALVDEHLDLTELSALFSKKDVTVSEMRPLTPSLEDVFVELSARHASSLEDVRA